MFLVDLVVDRQLDVQLMQAERVQPVLVGQLLVKLLVDCTAKSVSAV